MSDEHQRATSRFPKWEKQEPFNEEQLWLEDIKLQTLEKKSAVLYQKAWKAVKSEMAIFDDATRSEADSLRYFSQIQQ